MTERCRKNVLTFILSVLKSILLNDPISLRLFKTLLWMLRKCPGHSDSPGGGRGGVAEHCKHGGGNDTIQ